MIVSIVVAIAENNAIGKNNKLLWYLPADLKHFKNITTGHTVIMNR
jgi:dihydrofolate reductase